MDGLACVGMARQGDLLVAVPPVGFQDAALSLCGPPSPQLRVPHALRDAAAARSTPRQQLCTSPSSLLALAYSSPHDQVMQARVPAEGRVECFAESVFSAHLTGTASSSCRPSEFVTDSETGTLFLEAESLQSTSTLAFPTRRRRTALQALLANPPASSRPTDAFQRNTLNVSSGAEQ